MLYYEIVERDGSRVKNTKRYKNINKAKRKVAEINYKRMDASKSVSIVVITK